MRPPPPLSQAILVGNVDKGIGPFNDWTLWYESSVPLGDGCHISARVRRTRARTNNVVALRL